MAKQFQDLVTIDGEGVHQLTQYGVQYPDGTIQWGDPNNRSHVVIDSDLLERTGYNSDAEFYLDPERGGNKHTRWEELAGRYSSKLAALHAPPANLVLVQRTAMLALGPTTTVRIPAADDDLDPFA